MRRCQDPKRFNGHEVVCRWCDACVSNRIRVWTVRCMMERACAVHTLSLTLSYNEETEGNRRSARFFDYQDVSDWLKRLRRHLEYHNLPRRLRFAVAGEQGEADGRCHWHVVICTDADLRKVGTWLRPSPSGGKVAAALDDIATVWPEKAKRRDWSFWPHGFTTAQIPDYGGVRYAISYALKDAFGQERAKGTGREAKCEGEVASLFRPSKFPPLGTEFIDRELQRLSEVGAVLPMPSLKVPGLRAPFTVNVQPLRRQLLRGLRAINLDVRSRTGQDAAGWSVLLHNLRKSETDLGVLYGRENEVEKVRQAGRSEFGGEGQGSPSFLAILLRRVRRCGSSEPCSACLDLREVAELRQVGIERGEAGFVYRGSGDRSDFAAAQADGWRGQAHPWCVYRHTRESLGAFASYRRASEGTGSGE